MISGTFTDEAQYSQPVYVPSGMTFDYEILESTAAWAAHVTVQRLMVVPGETSQPADGNTGWTTVDEYDMNGSTPVAKIANTAECWFRLAILTGNYISGEADYRMNVVRVGG